MRRSEILAQYPEECRTAVLDTPSGLFGLSGAQVWKLATPRGMLCLRRWPEGYSPERIAWIHGVLLHLERCGFRLTPTPITTLSGATWMVADGAYWDLSPWMPGKPITDKTDSPETISAALTALGQFHVAAASFQAPSLHAPPAMIRRLQQTRDLLAGGLRDIEQAVARGQWPELGAQGIEWIHLFRERAPAILKRIDEAATWKVPLQVCLRDIHAEHVLVEGDRVTGLIDFDAMNVDSVAGDIARLLGSLVGDDRAGWSTGLAAYETVRPLNDTERKLVDVYDISATLLTGASWLTWVFIDQRRFNNQEAVLDRFDRALARLRLQQRVI